MRSDKAEVFIGFHNRSESRFFALRILPTFSPRDEVI